MCTVSWEQTEDRLSVVFSRDEAFFRAEASAPERLPREDAVVLAPRDTERGGTWLVANDHGLVLALVNRGPSQAGLRSRGQLPLQWGAARRLSEVVCRLPQQTLEEYPPFQLIGFQLGCPPVAFHWNGVRLEQLLALPRLITSSSVQSERVARHRRHSFQRYLQRLRQPAGLEKLLEFHLSTGTKPAFDVRMTRPHMGTVSVTAVEVTPRSVHMHYQARAKDGTFRSPASCTVARRPASGPSISERSLRNGSREAGFGTWRCAPCGGWFAKAT